MTLGRLALASLLLLAACDHRPEDFARVRTETAAFGSTWAQRVEALSSRHGALLQRAQTVPAGTAGLDEVLTALAQARSQIDGLSTTAQATTDGAAAEISARHRRLAGEALSRGEAALRTTAESVSGQLDAAAARLDAVVTAASDAAAAAAAVPPPPPSVGDAGVPITDPAFAKSRGAADVAGLAFQPGTAAFDLSSPATRAALDSVVAFAASCDQLRFAIVGHTAKDGLAEVNQRLSAAQADAVKKYLVASKVDPSKIAQTQGVGGTQPAVPEPDASSPEEQAMPVDQLAAIRAQNRRISVLVLEPCS